MKHHFVWEGGRGVIPEMIYRAKKEQKLFLRQQLKTQQDYMQAEIESMRQANGLVLPELELH